MPDEPMRYRGTVKWFAKNKGYGFIEWQEGSRDVFVNFTAILRSGQRNLEPGELVEFSVQETDRGWQAVRVIPLGPPSTENWGA